MFRGNSLPLSPDLVRVYERPGSSRPDRSEKDATSYLEDAQRAIGPGIIG